MRNLFSLLLSLVVANLSMRRSDGLAFGPTTFPLMQDLNHHLPAIHAAASSVVQSSGMADMTSNVVPPSWIHESSTNSLASSAVGLDSLTSSAPDQLFSSLLAKYRQALDAKPLQTKIVTGCILAILGDAIAQSREPEYNLKRAASFVAFDGCWRAVQVFTYGPLIQTCTGQFSLSLLNSLSSFLPGQQTQQLDPFLFGAMEQTLVSQLVMIPLIYYPVFYATTGLVQGLTVQETITRARETFIPLMKRNLMFWIPTQFATFGFVEENLQIPVLIVCGLIWTIILSLSAGNASEGEEPAFDSAAVEANMAQLGSAEAAMGLNGTSFYYGANVSTYFDDDEYESRTTATSKAKSAISTPIQETN